MKNLFKLLDVIKARPKIHLPATQSHHALTIRHYINREVLHFLLTPNGLNRTRGRDRKPMAAGGLDRM
jgi:hypothetical protein